MEYETAYKISIKTKKPLTEEDKLEIMSTLRYKVEGYHCEFLSCIADGDGEMILTCITPPKIENFLIPPAYNKENYV